MFLTINDIIVLTGLISFAGFISYTMGQIGNAIHEMLN